MKFPIEIRPEEVKAILKNGMLEVSLPKAEVVKKVHVEVRPSCFLIFQFIVSLIDTKYFPALSRSGRFAFQGIGTAKGQ